MVLGIQPMIQVLIILTIGTRQKRFNRCECDDSDHEWEVGDGDVARHLVFGV